MKKKKHDDDDDDEEYDDDEKKDARPNFKHVTCPEGTSRVIIPFEAVNRKNDS